jgi:ATP/maltotriose-dependent transcriptional regulator MalT
MLATLGRVVESIEVLDDAEALDVHAPLETFASLLSARAFALSHLGHDDSATEMFRRAADLLRKRNNVNAIAPCINNYAVHARLGGHIEHALLLHAEVTHLVEQARIPWRVQYYLLSHGITCYFAGDLKKASALLETASARLPCNRQVSIAQATLALLIGCSVGDDRLVASHSNGGAMNDALRSGEPSKIANIAAALYRYHTYTGAFDDARSVLELVLPVASGPHYGDLLFLMIGKSGDREALDRVAKQNATRNHASQIRHAYDYFFRARQLSLRGERGALHEADRAAQAFEYLKWPMHRAAALEIAQRFGESAGIYTSCGAHADAKNVRSKRSRRGRPRQVSGQLTLRQWEVAKLCVTGLRNHDIAARLGVGITTIEFHVRNILRELNLTSRYELRDVLPAPSDVAEMGQRLVDSLP